jgi:hypothetical protein
MIYSITFYPSSFIWSVKITLLFRNMSGLVLHLTATVGYNVYNLLVSFKGQKYITIILSIVLCRGDPHTLNVTEKCVLASSNEEMFRRVCHLIKTK